jgi:hypothetical protein
MTWVLVSISTEGEGPRLAQMREGEIAIGHDSEFIVALSESPIVAMLEEVVGFLQQYWGPEGGVALSTRFDATDAGMAHYHDGSIHGGAHGLVWTVLDDRSPDEMATWPWFDQDERSAYLARAILDGKLSNATEEERDLAVSWVAYLEEEDADRPRYGIREEPYRAEQRAFILELEADLAAADSKRDWKRRGERRELSDGTLLEVDNVRSDGGLYATWYCVSRYPNALAPRRNELIERRYLDT